jgi:hypothetical protein
MSLAEKFQITVPFKARPERMEEWATFESQRDTHGVQTPEDGAKLNRTPPGMDIANQTHVSDFQQGFGGDKDVSGRMVNAKALGGQGYTRLEMKSTDDQYGGEHVDLFYGEAVDENGDHGFAERNNYLDRL